MDTNKKYINALEKTFTELLENANNINKGKSNKKIVERAASSLLELITITDNQYSVEYNTILNMESFTLNEELKRLENLKNIIKNRLQYINSFVKKYKKVASAEMCEQFSSFLKDEKLQTIEETIKIIQKYMKNVNRINYLDEQIKINNDQLVAIEQNQLTYKEKNESLEDELNNLIKTSLQGQNLNDVDFKEKEVDYREYKELYNKLKEKVDNTKNPSESLLSTLKEAEEDYINSNNLYYSLKLLYNSEEKYTICEDCVQKRNKIEGILNNIIGLEMTNDIKELITKQKEKLSGQKQEAKRASILKLANEASMSEKEKLQLDNEEENVVRIVSKYPYSIETPKEEIPVIENPDHTEEIPVVDEIIVPSTEEKTSENPEVKIKEEEIKPLTITKIEEPKINILEGPSGLMIISANKPEDTIKIIEANKEKTIEWMKKVAAKLGIQENEIVKSR